MDNDTVGFRFVNYPMLPVDPSAPVAFVICL
jgi:hypothetical protein